MSTAAKRRLRTDLLTVIGLTIIIIGAFVALSVVDSKGDVTSQWSSQFYSWLLRR